MTSTGEVKEEEAGKEQMIRREIATFDVIFTTGFHRQQVVVVGQ